MGRPGPWVAFMAQGEAVRLGMRGSLVDPLMLARGGGVRPGCVLAGDVTELRTTDGISHVKPTPWSCATP